MLRAISADIAHAADPRHVARRPPAADPFELRDPEYIARTLPALRVMADVWFRADVRGLENIPPRGPVLLVGNHSGGTLIADTFIFSQAFYDHFGPERAFFQLAHDLVFKVPGIRAMLTPYGTVPACPENMRRALARGAALLVQVACAPSSSAASVRRLEAATFARTAKQACAGCASWPRQWRAAAAQGGPGDHRSPRRSTSTPALGMYWYPPT